MLRMAPLVVLVRVSGNSRSAHVTIGQGGWRDIADSALTWALNHAIVPR